MSCWRQCVDDCDCPNGTLCEPDVADVGPLCLAGDDRQSICSSCTDDQLCISAGDRAGAAYWCADVCDPAGDASCTTDQQCAPIGLERPRVCVYPELAQRSCGHCAIDAPSDECVPACEQIFLAVGFNRTSEIGRICPSGRACGGCVEGLLCAKAPDGLGSDGAYLGGTFKQDFACLATCASDADCTLPDTCRTSNDFPGLCASSSTWD